MKTVKLDRLGYLAFFFSGIGAMSSGVIVSLLQEQYGFAYGMTGTLLSVMNIGNLIASFAAGVLPARIGSRNTVLILCSGYALGYLLMCTNGAIVLLGAGFLCLGLAKGCAINNCTMLVSDHTKERTAGMNIMHASYACGALLGPVLINAALLTGKKCPMLALAFLGFLMWLTFLFARFPGKVRKNPGKNAEKKEKTDWSFMRDTTFWLLTGMIFCQNAAETSVTGWLVTYYKGSGILSGTLSNYTLTIMWGATLIARLLIAFVFPIRDRFKALAVMGIGCVVLYGGLMFSSTGVMAIVMLFCFAFSMAGVNPTGVAGAGNMLSNTSVGVMLPVAGIGGIVMPMIIGYVADRVSLQAGMMCNIVPCAGILVFSILCRKAAKGTQ